MPTVALVVLGRGAVGDPVPGRGEQAHDDQLWNGQQPGLHQDEAAGEPLGVVDVEVSGIVGTGQAERWVLVGARRGEGVKGDAPGPAQHAHVEGEDRIVGSGR